MAELLVSVRSAAEAAAALAGGAAIIDVKEPELGSLGRADDSVIAQVIALVGGKRPVSAACGELLEGLPPYPGPGLSFVKWGLAGCGRGTGFLARPSDAVRNSRIDSQLLGMDGLGSPSHAQDWPQLLESRRFQSRSDTVYVAYADWQCAQAPAVDDVADLACRQPGSVLLLDTCCKDRATLGHDRRPTLLDWLEVPFVVNLCQRCRSAQVRVALAGSLGPAEIEALLPARPVWFAVRGAVCADGDRRGLIDEEKVRRLVTLCTKDW